MPDAARVRSRPVGVLAIIGALVWMGVEILVFPFTVFLTDAGLRRMMIWGTAFGEICFALMALIAGAMQIGLGLLVVAGTTVLVGVAADRWLVTHQRRVRSVWPI